MKQFLTRFSALAIILFAFETLNAQTVVPRQPSPTNPNPYSNLIFILAPWKQGQKTINFTNSKFKGTVEANGTVKWINGEPPAGVYIGGVQGRPPVETRMASVRVKYNFDEGIIVVNDRGECHEFTTLPSDQNTMTKMDETDNTECCMIMFRWNFTGKFDFESIELKNVPIITLTSKVPIKILIKR